jgi:hypothetical protein
MTTRAQIEHEKREILIAARIARLRRLAHETALAFSAAQFAEDVIVGHPALIDDKSCEYYRRLPRRKAK